VARIDLGEEYRRAMAQSKDVETVERMIPAPPEKIFDLLADPRRHHDIDGSGTVREAKNAPERLTLGSKFGMSMKAGISYSMSSEVIEFEDGRRIAWQTRGSGRLGSRMGGRIWRYTLEPVDGGTLVRESWDISQEKTKFMVRLARKRTRASMEATLERIQQLVAD
jgi:uncharacterized protein YndB with AHSA1/START domain